MESVSRRGALALVLTGSLLVAACGDDGGSDAATTTKAPTTTVALTTTTAAPTTTADAMATTTAAPVGTIVDLAASNPDFSVLVEAVSAAGLVDTLNSAGPFTVFAPTNEAFTKALTALGVTKEQLLADKSTLTKILTYHVVSGAVPAAEVVKLNGQDVPTVNGATVKVTVVGSTVKVNDATVTATDITGSNGVIHVIDTVLVPPTA